MAGSDECPPVASTAPEEWPSAEVLVRQAELRAIGAQQAYEALFQPNTDHCLPPISVPGKAPPPPRMLPPPLKDDHDPTDVPQMLLQGEHLESPRPPSPFVAESGPLHSPPCTSAMASSSIRLVPVAPEKGCAGTAFSGEGADGMTRAVVRSPCGHRLMCVALPFRMAWSVLRLLACCGGGSHRRAATRRADGSGFAPPTERATAAREERGEAMATADEACEEGRASPRLTSAERRAVLELHRSLQQQLAAFEERLLARLDAGAPTAPAVPFCEIGCRGAASTCEEAPQIHGAPTTAPTALGLEACLVAMQSSLQQQQAAFEGRLFARLDAAAPLRESGRRATQHASDNGRMDGRTTAAPLSPSPAPRGVASPQKAAPADEALAPAAQLVCCSPPRSRAPSLPPPLELPLRASRTDLAVLRGGTKYYGPGPTKYYGSDARQHYGPDVARQHYGPGATQIGGLATRHPAMPHGSVYVPPPAASRRTPFQSGGSSSSRANAKPKPRNEGAAAPPPVSTNRQPVRFHVVQAEPLSRG